MVEPSPKTTSTTASPPSHPHISQASDILQDPARATIPRYRAYVHARNRFWTAFPDGNFIRLHTGSTNLECAFYAVVLSMAHQTPSSFEPQPAVDELREIFFSTVLAGRNESAGLDNENNLGADQIAAVFSEWGRGKGLRCQLGVVTPVDDDDLVPVMMNTPEADKSDPDEGIVRVWVYNDGWSLRGGMGHFEGIKRPGGEEGGEERV
ncbi:hypothetical protein B0H63DRAFT_539310 [Podospora didyma]|uniref:Uncharacterized protein n=1 Tax=Podospora didyma TaxID=330526 RepID=A0AAE0P073_9PEZI|nr:hypothetical protein B0H63DRAFT_539310 [Podospora didyma]